MSAALLYALAVCLGVDVLLLSLHGAPTALLALFTQLCVGVCVAYAIWTSERAGLTERADHH